MSLQRNDTLPEKTFAEATHVWGHDAGGIAARLPVAGFAAAARVTALEEAGGGRITYETWSILNGVTGSEGHGAEIPNSDGGTHTDPVVGGVVNNAGIYLWSVSPAGWKHIANLGVASVFGRYGVVLPQDEDYTAAQIAATPIGEMEGTSVQAALNYIDEVLDAVGSAITALGADKANATAVASALSDKANASEVYSKTVLDEKFEEQRRSLTYLARRLSR